MGESAVGESGFGIDIWDIADGEMGDIGDMACDDFMTRSTQLSSSRSPC